MLVLNAMILQNECFGVTRPKTSFAAPRAEDTASKVRFARSAR